jgi:hypothetical protein
MEHREIHEQNEKLERRIEAARTVPDIAGRDIGAGIIYLANGQPLLAQPTKDCHYFAV